ncbi:MAG TPA: hypothetical protein VEH55_01140 [Gaiellaceae bacterium]|nr:hypothetical protein [Gaiellaceae bacterium]
MRPPLLALAVLLTALVPATSHAEIPAACGAAPAFHAGPLGAVAYIRSGMLHVVDVSSRQDRALARISVPQYGTRPLAWSADGRWLSAGDLLIPAAGGRFCRPFAPGAGLYGGDADLDWAPHGDLLAATTARGVFLLRPGGTPRRILPARWRADGFSPRGTRIAAQGPLQTNTPSLWAVDLAGGRRTLLYRAPTLHVGAPVLARWTPDGRFVVFWTDSEDSVSIASDGLPLLAVPAGGGPAVPLAAHVLFTRQFVVPCGSGRVLVASGFDRYVSAHKSLELFQEGSWSALDLSADPSHSWYDPSCAPDGSSILATATLTPGDEDGKIDSSARMVFLLAPDGARRLLLGRPHNPVSYEGARFAKDGRHVLYLEHATRYGAPIRLRLLDLATGRSETVATMDGGQDYYGLHDLAGTAAWFEP